MYGDSYCQVNAAAPHPVFFRNALTRKRVALIAMLLRPLVRYALAALIISLELSSGLHAGTEKAPPPDKAVALPKVEVKGSLIRGFTISYGVKYLLWGPIDEARFEDVDAGSVPALASIKSGDRIVTINGRRVSEMKRKDFEKAMFANGVTLKLEIAPATGGEPQALEITWSKDFWDSKPTAK